MIRELWHVKRFKIAADFVGGCERVLDIGCRRSCETIDDGAFLKMIGRGTGLDIRDCKKKDFDFKKGSVEKIPFPDGHFDAVVATEIFEHLPNVKKAESEICRVLKDNGVFVFSSFSGSLFAQAIWFAFTNLNAAIYKHYHINVRKEREWKTLFSQNFSVERERCIWGLTTVVKFRKRPKKG